MALAGGSRVAAAAGVIGEKLVVGRIGIGESVALAGAIGIVDAIMTAGRARGSGVSFAVFAPGLDFAVLALAGFAFAPFFLSAAVFAAAGVVVSAGLAASAGALKPKASAHPSSRRDKQRSKIIPS